MKLTESTATTLQGGKMLRDDRFRGLLAIGRKGPTTWAYQTDLRRNGRFVRTVRVTLGNQSNMSLKQARIAAAKAQEQIRAGIDPNSKMESAKSLTLLDVIEDHIKERDLAERTEWDYRRHWTCRKLNTLYPLRKMHPGDVNRADCRAVKARLVKRGKTLASGALRVLRLTINHACRLDETIKENPAEFLIIPPTPRREVDPVDVKEFAHATSNLPFMWQVIWTTFLLTGIRRGSLLARRRDWPYGPHQLRHNFSVLATRAGTPFAEQRMLMTHALPGMGLVYTDPNALVEHLRQYSESIEDLVGDEVPKLFNQ